MIRGDRLEALYLVALGAGLRQGEILGLGWTDIDLEGATLTVRNALQRVDGRLELVEPKSVTSRRVVAAPGLRRRRPRLPPDPPARGRLLAGSRWHDPARACLRDDARDADRRDHHHPSLPALLAGAGLPRQRFHDLRHACASLLLAQGVAPRVVMETLGHIQISLTLNTYSHVMPALGREAAERMDEMLGPRTTDIAAG